MIHHTTNKIFFSFVLGSALFLLSCNGSGPAANNAKADSTKSAVTVVDSSHTGTDLVNQTPINLQKDSSAFRSALLTIVPTFRPVPMYVSLDLSHGVDFVNISVHPRIPAGENSLEINGVPYQLVKFHFHCPGEHKFEGQPCQMEMHLVFAKADQPDSLVVLGLPVFATARSNEFIKELWRRIPSVIGNGKDSMLVNLNTFDSNNGSLAAYTRQYWYYPGSLTTPEYGKCTWLVSNMKYYITDDQLKQFQNFAYQGTKMGKARGTQPIGSRWVLRNMQ